MNCLYFPFLDQTQMSHATPTVPQGPAVSSGLQYPTAEQAHHPLPQGTHVQPSQQQYPVSSTAAGAMAQIPSAQIQYSNQSQIPPSGYQGNTGQQMDSVYTDPYNSYRQGYPPNIPPPPYQSQAPHYPTSMSTAAHHQMYTGAPLTSQHPYVDRYPTPGSGYPSPSRSLPNQNTRMPVPHTSSYASAAISQQQYTPSPQTPVSGYQMPTSGHSVPGVLPNRAPVPQQQPQQNWDTSHSPAHSQYQMPTSSQPQHLANCPQPSPAISGSVAPPQGYIHPGSTYSGPPQSIPSHQPAWTSAGYMPTSTPQMNNSGQPSGQFVGSVPTQQPPPQQQVSHVGYPPSSAASSYTPQHQVPLARVQHQQPMPQNSPAAGKLFYVY